MFLNLAGSSPNRAESLHMIENPSLKRTSFTFFYFLGKEACLDSSLFVVELGGCVVGCFNDLHLLKQPS